MTASTLIIPVESQVREMDAKIFLACVAAERGFPVILGSRAFIHYKAASMPRGIYLAKSMKSLSIRMFGILRKLGHEIVAWEEEGLVRDPGPEYYRRRLSATALQQVARLFAWGPDDARVLREFPGYHGAPIHITGNPRVDLMRRELQPYFQQQVDDIHRRFGDFVLVNTNFGLVNHFFPQLSYLKNAMEAKGSGQETAFTVGWGTHKYAIFEHFKAMLPALCEALPDHNIVVRPHPSENHAPWKDLASRHNNLHVLNEGNVIPWLIATKALIANGCTSIVEASVIGTPVIDYQPVTSELFDVPLPQAVSYRALDIEELQTKVRAIVAGKLGPRDDPEQRAHLDQHIAARGGPLAAERIVNVLEQTGYATQQPPRASISHFAHGWLHTQLRTAVKRINMRRPGHRNHIAHHAHRFPDISAQEIQNRIERFGRQLDRFDGLRVRQISKHIFQIVR